MEVYPRWLQERLRIQPELAGIARKILRTEIDNDSGRKRGRSIVNRDAPESPRRNVAAKRDQIAASGATPLRFDFAMRPIFDASIGGFHPLRIVCTCGFLKKEPAHPKWGQAGCRHISGASKLSRPRCRGRLRPPAPSAPGCTNCDRSPPC